MSWILVVVLYALGIGIFHVLGGLGAAGDALREWGRWSSTDHRAEASPTS